MTNVFSTALTWVEKKTGIIKQDVVAIEPEIIAWATNFLSGITPIIKQAAINGVMAAISVPGTGTVKATAAVAAAAAELATAGIPIAEADLKAAVQIAYNSLPASVTQNVAANAVVNAADAAISNVAAEGLAAAPAAPAAPTA